MIVFDIETCPMADDQLRQFYIAPSPFDPSTVEPGTKQETTDRRIAKAKAEHEAKVATAWDDFKAKAPLDETLGRVLAIGYLREAGEEVEVKVDTRDEPELLATFWKMARVAKEKGDHMVGHNITGFDLPWLLTRSWVHGIATPRVLTKGRYWDPLFIDTMTVWSVGRYRTFRSADRLAKLLDAGSKSGLEVEGATFWKFFFSETPGDREKAIAYLENDVRIEYGIAKRLTEAGAF